MRGFVTFCDRRYLQLAEVLLDGLERVCDLPVEVFTQGFTLKSRWKNVRTHRIMTRFSSIYALKLYAASRTFLDHGVILDADMVPNLNAAELPDAAERFNKPFPLLARHGCPPQNWHPLMNRLRVSQETLRYGHATFLFSPAAKVMAAECLQELERCAFDGFSLPNADETVLNVILWKHKADCQINAFDPFEDVVGSYFAGEPPGKYAEYYRGTELSYHVFHGQKNPALATDLLTRLLAQDRENATTKRLLETPVALLA